MQGGNNDTEYPNLSEFIKGGLLHPNCRHMTVLFDPASENESDVEKITYDKDRYINYTSGSIGGCGYDKKSTSVANALNESPTIRKLFCEKGENVTSYGFRRKFDYSLPYLEGGVGCDCYSSVFKEMGYKFESIAHGDNFDVYNISKI